MTVDTLTPADRDRWAGLWRDYLSFYKTSLPPAQYDLTWAKLQDGRILGFAARDADGTLIGFAHALTHEHGWAAMPALYLQDLFVDPAARGGGAGRALLDAVIAHGRATDASRIYWTTKQDNAAARALYDRVAAWDDFVRYSVPVTG